MFTSIKVENYKILQDFEYDGFKLINTFASGSNTGKTTLLEAIFLLCGYFDIRHLLKILDSRKIGIGDSRALEILFSDLKARSDNFIQVSGQYDDSKVEFCYKPILQGGTDLYGLSSDYEHSKHGKGRSLLEYVPDYEANVVRSDSQKKPSFNLSEEVPQNAEPVTVNFYSAHQLFSSNNAVAGFSTIVRKRDGLEKLVNVLDRFFPEEKIENIINTNGVIEVITRDRDTALPFNLLGGGSNKIFSILCGLTGNYKVLLIDEIENGIHYSKMKPFLKHLFREAIDKKIQLFITTHSRDVIQAVDGILKEDDEEINSNFQHCSLGRDIRKDNLVTGIRYSAEEFVSSNQTSNDIRS